MLAHPFASVPIPIGERLALRNGCGRGELQSGPQTIQFKAFECQKEKTEVKGRCLSYLFAAAIRRLQLSGAA